MKRAILAIVIIFICVAMFATFSACNSSTENSMLTIYKNRSNVGEFTKAEYLGTLPVGYRVLTSTTNYAYSEYGYQKELDGFIVYNENGLNFIKTGASDVYFQNLSFNIKQIHVYYGNIFMMTSDTKILVYDYDNDKWLYGTDNPLCVPPTINRSISTYVYAISKDYFLTISSPEVFKKQFGVDKEFATSYFVFHSNGNMVGRIDATATVSSKLGSVDGFDTYAVVNNITGSNGKETRIFNLTGLTSKNQNLIEPNYNGVFSYASGTNNGLEVTYFGNGKFLVHIEEEGDETDYFYKDEKDEYWKVRRYIFHADTGTRETYRSDTLFLSIENEYYKYSTTKTYDTSQFLQPGYSYVSYGIVRDKDKTVSYDEFIIKNSDFTIVNSLTKNYGSVEFPDTDAISLKELLLFYVGGIGVVQSQTGVLNIYNTEGEVIASNNEHMYQSATYNSGMIVCTIVDEENSSDSSTALLYGAVNTKGQITVPFIYDSLTLFTGFYAIGQRDDENGDASYYLVGKNGYEVFLGNSKSVSEDYSFHINNNGGIYKTGCYVYSYVNDKGTKLYGVKSTNASPTKNLLLEAKYTTVTLFSPSSEFAKVYVFCIPDGGTQQELYILK